MSPRWEVSFKGVLGDEARAELRYQKLYLERSHGDSLGNCIYLLAADGDAAIARVADALKGRGEFGDFSAELVRHIVVYGFLPSEASALEAALEQESEKDDRQVSMAFAADPSHDAEMLMRLAGETKKEVLARAKRIYGKLRERAGLDPASPLYVYTAIIGPDELAQLRDESRHEELARQARSLFDEGIYAYAVVAAQTSCEVMVFEGITELLNCHWESAILKFVDLWLASSGKTASLREDGQRSLWNLLTHDEIQKESWWQDYQRHLVRRHGIVHRGTMPDRYEAEHSLRTTERFRAHLAHKLREERLKQISDRDYPFW